MRRAQVIAFLVSTASLLLLLAAASFGQQTPASAPALPPGMTGADVNDPRAKLTPGLYDAGETAMGLKHLIIPPDSMQ